jgi:hypothetical protein
MSPSGSERTAAAVRTCVVFVALTWTAAMDVCSRSRPIRVALLAIVYTPLAVISSKIIGRIKGTLENSHTPA